MLGEHLRMSQKPVAAGPVKHTQPGVCSAAALRLFPPLLSKETLGGPEKMTTHV